MIDSSLENQTELDRWRIGGPSAQMSFGPPSNTGIKVNEIVTIRGGALQLDDRDRIVWRSRNFALQTLWGLYDFDGDGALEVLASSSSLSLSTEQWEELWALNPMRSA